MRIRKHAMICPLMYAASSLKPGTVIQCRLNMSPWDVMNFSPPLPSPSFQVNGTDNLAKNGSLGESNAAFQSAASPKIAADDGQTGEIKAGKWDNSNGDEGNVGGSAHDNSDEGPANPGLKKEKEIIYCAKTDGKAWKCKNEAAEGNSLCKHHFSQVRNYYSALPTTKHQDKEAADSKHRPRAKKAASTSNPNEFYYYSGFGPRWGKKRGGKSLDVPKNVEQEREMIQPTFSQINNEEFEIEYEVADEEGGNSGRKKARKPIKARSLKSLM
ncbi:Hypothetical predicted protein [Olea europaea subsp. europaea]|uniref:WRC domain-containing protein n=1 Tax=Olea europaea subsp. europaea TaxID=158383 RepID=A0A8S0P819_OLEEU|nr:Hypothetical predicted protein [Olea europaea subsp. europaea]